ncbi:MAG: hypothetical protein R3F53_08025 [Gammaproteobacteria bacterium]
MSHQASPAHAIALQVTDVVKSYGSRTALAGISLQVEAGQFVALLDRMVPEKKPPCSSC